METKELTSLPLTEEHGESDSLLLITDAGAKRIPASTFRQNSGCEQADWNAAEGKPGHVLNRTHWTETVEVTPTFDGDISGREAIYMGADYNGAYAVKVTPQYVTVDELIGSTMVIYIEGTEYSDTIINAIDTTSVLGVAGSAVPLGDGGDISVLSLPNDSTIMGVHFSAGTWIMCIPGAFYVKSLSCLQPVQTEDVHKLPEKFLPDYLPSVEVITEDPTFDGDMTGREIVDLTSSYGTNAYFVKASSRHIDPADMLGVTATIHNASDDSETDHTFTASEVINASMVFDYEGTVAFYDEMFVVTSFPQDTVLEGLLFTAGTWFIYIPDMMYVKSLSCLEAGEVELVHKLDEKFLPNNISTTVVTVTDDGNGNYTADKTFKELNKAYKDGKMLYCAYEDTTVLLHLAAASPGYHFKFEGVQSVDDVDTIAVKIYNDNSIVVTPKTVVSQSDLPTRLPNPSKIMFVGALAGTANNDSYMSVKNHEYDGSGRLYVRGIPNPKALTINGTSYDGKTAVTLELPTAGLPEVSEENNGAFLRVVNGLWTAAAITNAEGVSF